MRKLKIDTLEKLEAFVNNASISIESRLQAFSEALKGYDFFIINIRFDDNCKTIENPEAVEREMQRVIEEIRSTPESPFIRGFAVWYETPA